MYNAFSVKKVLFPFVLIYSSPSLRGLYMMVVRNCA